MLFSCFVLDENLILQTRLTILLNRIVKTEWKTN
jgi:hypothetical protein